jgi:colicin import membrane protein
VYQEIQVTYMNNNGWKLPLNLAIGLHLVLVLAVIYMPRIFHSSPKYPQIYTVNLVNIPEPAAKKTAPPRITAHHKAITAKPKVKKIEPPKTTPAPVEKALSLKPLKRKIEKDTAYDKLIAERLRRLRIQERRERALEEKKKLERIHRQQLAESIRAEQKAAQEARQAADELRQALNATASTSNQNSKNQGIQSNGNHGVNNNFNAIENQYFASISNRIQQFWALPDIKPWDPTLSVIVWITIDKNGSIINQHFENSSGDKFFDQYVEKTLRDAVPLPQIPAALNKAQIEVGLRFKPSGIQ